jgi:glycerol-3-phosphate cytidylyltransferase
MTDVCLDAAVGDGDPVVTSSMKVGYAPGVFDLFHIGHLNLLRNARGFCDYLIAGVVTDVIAERNKGIIPVVPFEERLEIVRSIRYVDEAVAEDVPSKLEQWQRLRFDLIVKGNDWIGTERGKRLEADFAPVGVAVFYVPYTPQTSSTMLRRALQREIEGIAPTTGG